MQRWTEERVKMAMAMRYSGMSMSQIALSMNVSRNSVAGAFHRERKRINKPKPAAKVRVNSHLMTWSDENLTESWAEYRLRKQAERKRLKERENAEV